MNRKIFAGFVFFVCMIFALLSYPAFAAEGFYVAPQVGISILNDAGVSDNVGEFMTIGFDTGYGLGISAGYDFGVLRVEGEAGYREYDIDSVTEEGIEYPAPGDTNALSLLLNCFVDFETGTGFTPFAGGGIGIAKVEFCDFVSSNSSDDDTVFAYQLVAGVGYAFTENVTLDVSYRYFATADLTFGDEGDNVDVEYGSHNVYMGVRFSF